MQIQLSKEAQAILDEKIVSGYSDAGEYLSSLLLRADEYDQLKLERLRRELQIGIDELDRGEGIPFNRDEITKEIEKAENAQTFPEIHIPSTRAGMSYFTDKFPQASI